MSSLRVDVWSDIACPWCYVGKRRLEAAIATVGKRADVEVVWHAFELDPGAPPVRDASEAYAARLAKKYGTSPAKAQGMIANMTSVAALDGLEFHFERVRAGNTFDAHRLIHLAGERGLQDAMKERLLRAYMTEGEAIGDREVLVRLATEAGLDAEEVRSVLASDGHAAAVREDEATARELGITGVPFFVIERTYAVSGAQPAEVLATVLNRALDDQPAKVADGAVCGPDGCA